MIQRSILWSVPGALTIGASLFTAIRLLARVANEAHPTIVGATLFKRDADLLGGLPLYAYVGDYPTRSGVLSINLIGGPKPIVVRALFTNVKPNGCKPSPGATLLSGPTLIGTDVAFYSLHQASERKIYVVEVEIAAHAPAASISCDVLDHPERETFTTRRIAFLPPLTKEITAHVIDGGYKYLMPMMVSIQRVTESTGFNTSGGVRVHDHRLASLLEASYLNPEDLLLRAFWTDERARSAQTFWLFVLAGIVGAGFAMLVEAVRPIVESLASTALL